MASITAPAPAVTPTAAARTGDRFVATALFALAASMLLAQIVIGTVIPPLAVPAVLYSALGTAVWRRGSRWLLLTAAVLPVLHLAASAAFIAGNLAHPESPGGFIPESFAVLSGLAAAVGAVLGLRGVNQRGGVALGAGGLAVAAVAVSMVAAAGVQAPTRVAGDVGITVERATFPDRVELPAGGAGLWLVNSDPVRHTFVVDDTPVKVELPASSTVRTEVDLAAGSYRFFCDVPGHEFMEAELVVTGSTP